MTDVCQEERWLGSQPDIAEADIRRTVAADIVVVGGGLAGVASVRQAAELGASVVLLEKCAAIQARSGDFAVMDTKVAEVWGRRDVDKAAIVRELVRDMGYKVSQDILRRWAGEAGEAFDWYLEGMDEVPVMRTTFEDRPQRVQVWLQPRRLPLPEGFDNARELYKCYQVTAWVQPSHIPLFRKNFEKAEATGLVQAFFNAPVRKLLRQEKHRVAFGHFLRAGAVDALLEALDQADAPTLTPGEFEQLRELLADLDDGQKLAHPIAFLRFVRLLSMSGEKGATVRCWDSLVKLEELIARAPLETGRRHTVLREMHAVWRDVVFNDLDAMVIHSRKAQDYFAGGCSSIITREKAFTYGSPHFLHLFHNQAGRLSMVVDTFAAQHHLLTGVVNDCGTGCDSVAKAEYALETCAFDQVELHAYKAVYKARTAEQVFLILCANFCLARLALVRGKRAESLQLMDALKKDVLKAQTRC